MKTLSLGLITTLLVAACAIPGMGMLQGKGSSSSSGSSSSYARTETTEEVNGQPVEPEEAEAPRSTKKKKAKVGEDGFGDTCRKNSDCASNTCFVGHGNLGYCTKMCNSWSECPSHWECQRAANAPQKICMQD